MCSQCEKRYRDDVELTRRMAKYRGIRELRWPKWAYGRLKPVWRMYVRYREYMWTHTLCGDGTGGCDLWKGVFCLRCGMRY